MLNAPEDRFRRRILGAAVIVAAIVIALVAVVRPTPFAHTHSVWAEFDSVQGLGSIDRDVRVGGVNVGKVGDVKREGDDARVELVIDDSIVIHSDARANLRPHTLFEGSAFVDLSPGSPSAPPIADGAVIPREHTTVYVSLDKALRILREPNRVGLRSIIREASRTLQGGAVRGLQTTLRNGPSLTRNLAPAARALQGPHGDELASAVAGLAGTSRALAAHEQQLGPLVKHANTTLAALEVDSGAPLDRTLRQLPGALEELERGGPDLTTTVDRLGALADAARPGVPDLTAALLGFDPLLRRSPAIVERARPMVSQLHTVIRRSAEASPAITSLNEALLPGTRTLGGSVLPYGSAPSKFGPPNYIQLLSTFAAATGSLNAYQTPAQNPLGEGHLVRLGSYFDQSFLSSGIPSCGVFAAISPAAATQAETLGICQP